MYTHMNTITFAHTYVYIIYTFFIVVDVLCSLKVVKQDFDFLSSYVFCIFILVDVLGTKTRTSVGASFRSRVIAYSLVYELVQYDSSSPSFGHI